MSAPMILNEDLSDKRLANVQILISTFINQSVPESLIPVLEKCPQVSLPENITGNEVKHKYKICVIEKGQIIFPDEPEDTSTDPITVTDCDVSKLNDAQASSREKDFDENLSSNPADVTKTEVSETLANHNETAKAPTVKKIDDEVLGKLLDYYRKFNERQLGLEVSDQVPTYKKSSQPPEAVICNNDIIKEAVMRVNEQQEAGDVILEPTITEFDDDNHKIPFDEFAAYSQIRSAEEEEENCSYIPEDFQCKDKDNYEDEWKYGANFIEKTLQRRIDEGKCATENNKKWDQNDIIKLVEMLSKKRDKSVKRQSREWSSRAGGLAFPDCRDDLLDQLEEIDDNKEVSLFDQLKLAPANDDSLELKMVVEENCNPNRNDKIIHSKYNTYSGGDELDVMKNYVMGLFNCNWLWSAYDKVVNKLFDGPRYGANDGIASGYDVDSTSFKWKLRLNRVKSISGWLSRGWIFGSTGKPIYKQVEYEKTKVVTWQERYAREVGDYNKLKKRNLRGISEETVLDLEGSFMSSHVNQLYTNSFGSEGQPILLAGCETTVREDTILDIGL